MSYYNNNQGGYGQQGGGYGGQQGGYGQHHGGDRPGPGGEANSYYQDGNNSGYGQPPQHHQQNFSPPPYQNQNDSYGGNNQGYRNDGPGGYGGPGGPQGEDGERGLGGALVGGAAGAFGGNKIGGNFGHSKSSTVIGALAGAFAGHKMQDGVSDWKDKRDEKKEEEKRREEEERRREEEDRRRREDEKHHHHRRSHSRSRSRSRSPPRHRSGGNFAGGFTGSARDIRLDAHGDYNLRASCKRRDGSWQESTISLNRILTNDQGSFRWHSGGAGGGSQSYTVQQGDTLRNIGDRFGTSWEEIARRNNISNPDQIWPGQNLQIGGGGGGSGGNFGASARDVRLVDGGSRLEAELSRNGQYVRSSINLDERIANNDGTLVLV
ncbi:CVNH domain-containing protein [Colletotrichum plurivorum]|uniref:CVNH domain-containing protein n=1 Tax=Colletotrichum plurivorum TaxID=2175906 RepID=A0A8H6KF24_9PEZI|nr:CVNH domain-containing protein [Colletotrichum plurivorum]